MRAAAFIAVLGALSFHSAVAQNTAAPSGEEAVRETVNGFKQALRQGNPDAALAYLHPEARVYESGHAESREEYRSGHLAADIAFLQAVESETTWDHVSVESDMAMYLSQYSTRGTFRGREIDSHGTETMVLVPTDVGWKIVHIHWSSGS